MNGNENTSVPVLEVREIVKYYGNVIALNGVSMTLMPGEVMCLLGDNGAGKSSLIKVLSGVITPDQALSPTDTAAVQVATISFGVGNWYLVRGDTANARTWFKRAVASQGWPGFAFFAAETDLRRLK